MKALVELVQTDPPSRFLWWTSEEWLWRVYADCDRQTELKVVSAKYEANDYLVGISSSREEALADARAAFTHNLSDDERREATREFVEIGP